MQRRTFLLSTAVSAARMAGANERVRGAIIGSGGRGQYLTENFKELGVEMAAVCDVYEPNLNAGLKAASTGAKGIGDYKRVLEDRDIDVVVIATPDHWHAQMVIDAVEAGKDVYVEKPMVHKIDDGFRVIEAVRRTNRVVQVGMQRRSFDIFQEGKALMERLGDVRLVNAWWLNHTKSLTQKPLEGKLDWNQWLGPARRHEADALRFFNWYYFWDYSGGLMVGQAAHVIDAIQWFMNSTYPVAVTCAGGRVNLPGAEVPETTSMAIEYPENYLAVFTVGYKAMRYAPTNDQLEQFHGSKARLDMGREGYALYPQSDAVDTFPTVEKKQPGSFGGATRAHIRNFLECVRSRKDPNATVEMGQQTSVVLCMAMDALRGGRRLKWNSAERRAE
ncbi:MAG TPA: Gfo/Idh/MocA family oxidoreductase [Bryobacteraceae bacterium]|nr:Gfo/Idh/MocA family oxidoreductase [Bryobacteraceae bacterium]